MALQAQSPVYLHFPDFRVRPEQPIYGSEIKDLMPPIAFAIGDFEGFSLQSATDLPESKHFQISDSIANIDNVQLHQPEEFFCGASNGAVCGSITGSRKRPRICIGASSSHIQAVADFGVKHLTHYTGPSTGLNLTFQDEKLEPLAPTSNGMMRKGVPMCSIFIENLLPQLSQQEEEIDDFIKIQEEQFRRTLHQKRLQHSRAMLAIIESWLTRTLRQKELELEKVKSKNAELEEKTKSLFQQACAWQNRAKFNEAMIFTLRSNLQQAVTTSREQFNEACGDSYQADDAESICLDDKADAKARALKENKQLKEQRSCKVCRNNDASVLLLPCRHLCLCKECDVALDSCPLCRSFKSASVQVYLT